MLRLFWVSRPHIRWILAWIRMKNSKWEEFVECLENWYWHKVALVTGRDRSNYTDWSRSSSCFSSRTSSARCHTRRLRVWTITLYLYTTCTRDYMRALCVLYEWRCSDRNARTRIVGYKRTCVSPPAPLPPPHQPPSTRLILLFSSLSHQPHLPRQQTGISTRRTP